MESTTTNGNTTESKHLPRASNSAPLCGENCVIPILSSWLQLFEACSPRNCWQEQIILSNPTELKVTTRIMTSAHRKVHFETGPLRNGCSEQSHNKKQVVLGDHHNRELQSTCVITLGAVSDAAWWRLRRLNYTDADEGVNSHRRQFR